MFDLDGMKVHHVAVPNAKWCSVGSFGDNADKAVDILAQLEFTARRVGNYDVQVLGDKLTSEKARRVFTTINLSKIKETW